MLLHMILLTWRVADVVCWIEQSSFNKASIRAAFVLKHFEISPNFTFSLFSSCILRITPIDIVSSMKKCVDIADAPLSLLIWWMLHSAHWQYMFCSFTFAWCTIPQWIDHVVSLRSWKLHANLLNASTCFCSVDYEWWCTQRSRLSWYFSWFCMSCGMSSGIQFWTDDVPLKALASHPCNNSSATNALSS